MATTRRAVLKFEPYESLAIDGDGDGVVQEGTAWERPVGTRLLDEAGAEIRAGAVAGARPGKIRVIDQTGRNVAYTPTYGRGGAKPGKQSTLAALGYQSLAERGLQTIGQISGKETLGPQLGESLPNVQGVSPTPKKPKNDV